MTNMFTIQYAIKQSLKHKHILLFMWYLAAQFGNTRHSKLKILYMSSSFSSCHQQHDCGGGAVCVERQFVEC